MPKVLCREVALPFVLRVGQYKLSFDQFLLENKSKVNVDQLDAAGLSALHLAVTNRLLDVVSKLLNAALAPFGIHSLSYGCGG